MSFLKHCRDIIHLALPLTVSRLADVGVYFGLFVAIAQLGHAQFAASSIANSIFSTIVLVAVGILFASGILFGHCLGANDPAGVRSHFYGGFVLALCLSTLGALALLAASAALPYLGQSPAVLPYAKQCLYACCLPMLPMMINLIFSQLLTAMRLTRILIVSKLLGAPITLFLGYGMILGRWGFPHWGIWGFGWALVAQALLNTLMLLGYMLVQSDVKQLALFKPAFKSQPLWTSIRKLLQLGCPMGVQFGMELAAFTVIVLCLGHINGLVLSAYQIASQICILALMFPFSISESTAILVARANGASEYRQLHQINHSALYLIATLMAAIATLFYAMPTPLIRIYISITPEHRSLIAWGIQFLFYGGFCLFADGIRHTLTGGLRGLGDSNTPMLIGIITVWSIGLPLGLGLVFPLGLGPIGFQIAMAFSFSIASAILYHRLRKKISILKTMHAR